MQANLSLLLPIIFLLNVKIQCRIVKIEGDSDVFICVFDVTPVCPEVVRKGVKVAKVDV